VGRPALRRQLLSRSALHHQVTGCLLRSPLRLPCLSVCVCAMILQSKIHGSLLLGVCWSLSHSPRSVVFVVEFVLLLGRSWAIFPCQLGLSTNHPYASEQFV
jgi:hypothetical protein